MPVSREVAYPTEPVILLNIAREWDPALSAEALYERTRQYWICAPQRHAARYALAVAEGVVREVYRIEAWHQVDMATVQVDPERKAAGKPLPQRTVRQAFEGHVDEELKRRYVGKSVRHLLSQNPVKWLNC